MHAPNCSIYIIWTSATLCGRIVAIFQDQNWRFSYKWLLYEWDFAANVTLRSGTDTDSFTVNILHTHRECTLALFLQLIEKKYLGMRQPMLLMPLQNVPWHAAISTLSRRLNPARYNELLLLLLVPLPSDTIHCIRPKLHSLSFTPTTYPYIAWLQPPCPWDCEHYSIR